MTAPSSTSNRLVPQVNEAVDHVLGPADSQITLVEYGRYDCPYCRAANERIAELRDEFVDQMRYVRRHRPIPGSDLALRAAELAERAAQRGKFWEAHVELMTRSPALSEDDLRGGCEASDRRRAAARRQRRGGPVRPSDFAATKIAVFAASGLAAAIGTFVLWHTSRAGKAPSREAASEAVPKACTVIDEGVGEPA